MRKIITSGNQAVVIHQNADGGRVFASLYVNARNGIDGADITNIQWAGWTVKGAERWAAKQLER